ncbi:hypothetical protein EV646_112288 [Kribbella antiqua]|uniref:Uncharacterized protein n=1 Tax=Kribbella antiqua TaxID=2512217 RepID=A0A4V2S3D8_9ACTN|nr:hypothetical protein [Kribbella antiqua]TCO43710.1 hypothetical protein EV646_112288 [Kribbella antiqua]
MSAPWLNVDGEAVRAILGQRGLQYMDNQSANRTRTQANAADLPNALGNTSACMASTRSSEVIDQGAMRNVNRAQTISDTGMRVGNDTTNTVGVVTSSLTLGDVMTA